MLVTIGDSHTAGMRHIMNDEPEYLSKYKVWPEVLSEKLNLDLKSLSKPGQPLTTSIQLLIDNLQYIIDNAKIVIFEWQHFQNTLLHFDNVDVNSSSIVLGPTKGFKMDGTITRGVQEWHKLVDNEIVDKNDEMHLIHWFWKFQERATWYEMQKVYGIFNFLEKNGIKCFAFYWIQPDIINVIDNNYVIKFKSPYIENNNGITKFVTDLRFPTLQDENPNIKDGHIGIDGNIELANQMYDFINKKQILFGI